MIRDSFFVRVVLLNYNESQLTLDLVKQLKCQSHQNFEIVVVDNASTPDHILLLHKNLPSSVHLILSEHNLGYSKGNNLGMQFDSGKKIDFHLVLNNDLIIEDTQFIEQMILGFLSPGNEKVVASSPLVDTISTGTPLEKQIQVRKILGREKMFMLSVPLFTPFISKILNDFLYRDQMPYIGKYMFCESINGAAFMVTNTFIKDNQYLDQGTFLYFEEIILGCQIKKSGKICLLNGKTSVKHLQGVSTKSNAKTINPKMERFKYESALYYLRKYEKLGKISSGLFIFLNEISIKIKQVIS